MAHDAQLVTRNAGRASHWSRDPDAFEVFYREHVDAIEGFVARRVGDRDLAADLTADVFVAAIESGERYHPSRGAPIAWLFGIARLVVASRLRRDGRERRATIRLSGPGCLTSTMPRGSPTGWPQRSRGGGSTARWMGCRTGNGPSCRSPKPRPRWASGRATVIPAADLRSILSDEGVRRHAAGLDVRHARAFGTELGTGYAFTDPRANLICVAAPGFGATWGASCGAASKAKRSGAGGLELFGADTASRRSPPPSAPATPCGAATAPTRSRSPPLPPPRPVTRVTRFSIRPTATSHPAG